MYIEDAACGRRALLHAQRKCRDALDGAHRLLVVRIQALATKELKYSSHDDFCPWSNPVERLRCPALQAAVVGVMSLGWTMRSELV